MRQHRFDFVKRLIVPRSLRFQLFSRTLFILAGLLLLIGALQYVFNKDFLYRNQAEAMFVRTSALPRDLLERSGLLSQLPHPGIPLDNGRPRGPVVFLPDTSLAYIDSGGKFIDLAQQGGLTAPRLTNEEYSAILKQLHSQLHSRENVAYQVVRNAAGTEQIIVFRLAYGRETVNGVNGLFQMGTSTSPLLNVLMRQLLIFAVLVFLALVGGLALLIPVLRRTLNPLNMMVKSVEKTDAGNLDERFPASQGQLEVDLLADSFNRMLERLETAFDAERAAKEQMRRFIADASHELRTPLTSIHGFLEVLLRGAADKREQLYAALNSMHGESTRMKKLVEDLLTLAKLDRAPQLQMVETQLNRLVIEMEPHLRMLAGERNVRFDLTAGIWCVCDPDKIKQVILNLFQNAVQHTDPKKGVITVALTVENQWAEIKVGDNGFGIAPEHLSHLFERFYRSDSSRTRKMGGAGLGLAISQSIVQAHGGIIDVDSRKGVGSSFRVLLPEA
jgi:two-component system, OmpR family, sensor kinase